MSAETGSFLGRQPKRAASPNVVASIVGAEVGAAAGLLFAGGRLFAPLIAAGTSAALGPIGLVVWRRCRCWPVRLWLRAQLRRAHETTAKGELSDSPGAARDQ